MDQQRKSTMVELVAELEATGDTSPYMLNTIAEAKAGEYHDFKNNKYMCGKVAVVERLRNLKQDDLAKRVMNGEFDEAPDAEDLEEMRKTTPKSMHGVLGLDK